MVEAFLRTILNLRVIHCGNVFIGFKCLINDFPSWCSIYELLTKAFLL